MNLTILVTPLKMLTSIICIVCVLHLFQCLEFGNQHGLSKLFPPSSQEHLSTNSSPERSSQSRSYSSSPIHNLHPVSAPNVHTNTDKTIAQLRSPNLRDPFQYLPRSRSMETAPPSNTLERGGHKLSSISHDQMVVGHSPLSCSLSHVSSCSEESDQESQDGGMDDDSKCPLARFDTMSELQSNSSVSTVTSSDPPEINPYPPVDGYCYYTDVELASPKSQMGPHSGRQSSTQSSSPRSSPSPSLSESNQLTTQATIEGDDHKLFLLPNSPWPAAKRGGVASAISKFENLRGRTSTLDRYTLTYDSESIDSSNTLEGIPVRPSDLQFVPADGKYIEVVIRISLEFPRKSRHNYEYIGKKNLNWCLIDEIQTQGTLHMLFMYHCDFTNWLNFISFEMLTFSNIIMINIYFILVFDI